MDRQVVAVLDGSIRGESVLPEALSSARESQAMLRLLQVVSPRSSIRSRMADRDAERTAWLYLITIAERLKETYPRITYQVRAGRTAVVLRAEAAKAEAVFLAAPAGALRRLRASLLARHTPTAAVFLIPAEPGERSPVRSFDKDAAARGPLFQRALGMRAVGLDRVVGSVGRAHELEAGFRPLSAGTLNLRYRELRLAMERGAEVPPIELYKLDDRYYILDGHHRVSIALSLGQLQIDAIITEFVPMHDADAKVVAGERMAFERDYGLECIEAVSPGTYPLLAALIRDHGRRNKVDAVRHAAQDWYLRVYLPLERRLKAASLWPFFPGDGPGDLVAYLARLKEYREAFLGQRVSWDAMLDLLLQRCRRMS